jgi:transcriptional regulator with XRE-family HTH domain
LFRRLLDAYQHPDGGAWNGARMEEATAGFVNASYFSNLLNDRIKQPGLDKLKAIAETMGFPAQLWLEDPETWGDPRDSAPLAFAPEDVAFEDLLENLFASLPDERTGEPPTNAEVARRTAGKVTEAEFERMRSGDLRNPTLEQLLALSRAFDVDPAYWFRRGKGRPLVDQEVVEALRDEENRLILHRSLALSKGQKDMLLVLLEQLQKRDDL